MNLSPWAIGEIVKARVAAAGLVDDFAAHSLRSNFATSAAHSGFGEAAIMKHGRWKSVAVARRYTRADNRWDESDSVLLRKADARDTCPFWSFPTNRATTR